MLTHVEIDQAMPTVRQQVSTLVVFENELLRHGLLSMLNHAPAVGQSWSCATIDHAFDLVARHRPNIVLCPGTGSLAARLAAMVPVHGGRLLVLLEDLALEEIEESIMRAAHGFLVQSELTVATLHEAIEKLRIGEVSLSAGLARNLMARARGAVTTRPRREICLTPRERQVLGMLAGGLSNKQIARRLGISEHGVKRHVTNLLAKLNAANRTLAVARALQEGLIGPGD
ncbi:MAG TPA: response regulator transcription factor [Micromonosporaceae bacterium]